MNLTREEDEGKWWLLSGSLESITAALQTVVTLTTTTRNLVSSCFPCWNSSKGSSTDGAWFDCEQFQSDHPSCYENHVALELNDGPISTKDCCQKDASLKQNDFLENQKTTSLFNSTLDRSSDLPDVSHKGLTSNEMKNDRSNGIATPLSGRKPKSISKLKKYEQSIMDSSSFVYKLERDNFAHRSHDILRAEGEVMSPKFIRSKSERFHHRPSIRSPVLERRKLTSKSLDLHSQYLDWEEESLASLEEENSLNFGEIWQPYELENAFEMFNSTSLKSLGFLNAIQQKKSFKTTYDKFEDIFPTLANTHDRLGDEEPNNNNLLLSRSPFKPRKRLKTSQVWDKSLVTQKSEKEINSNIENGTHCILTIENLKTLINLCIFVSNMHEVDLKMAKVIKNDYSCDKFLTYCGKSFKSKLIYDLVKEAIKEHVLQYSNSLPLFVDYPVEIIENKVIAALRFGENCNAYQRALIDDEDKVRQNTLLCSNLSEFAKVPDEILIENVTGEEIRKEGRLWQNVTIEENEIKTTLSKEIFNDLLSKEISVLDNLLSKKLNTILSPQREHC